MDEMNKEVILDQDDSIEEPIQVNETEEVARKGGWKPKEEWEGNPEDWITAREFNHRGELLDRIKTQSSHIKKLEKKQSTLETTINELADHHRKVAETARKEALEELKNLKKQALDLGEHDKVVDIDDRIDDLKREKIEAKQEQKAEQDELHPLVSNWIQTNSWYNTDRALKGAMDAIVQDIIEEDPSMKGQVGEVLELAEKRIRDEFPGKFKKVTSTVTEPSSTKKEEKKYSSRSLSEQERRMASKFIKAGAIKSYDEYAKQLADLEKVS